MYMLYTESLMKYIGRGGNDFNIEGYAHQVL
jgi:hypothetical protein